ncbi:MAG: cytochrome c [Hyphomicrobiales bacterium]
MARGKELLEQNCARCHAIGKTGTSTHPQAPPFRQVMKTYPASSLTEALGEGLVTGHPDMPEFVFPPEDVGAIVDYLHTLEGP